MPQSDFSKMQRQIQIHVEIDAWLVVSTARERPLPQPLLLPLPYVSAQFRFSLSSNEPHAMKQRTVPQIDDIVCVKERERERERERKRDGEEIPSPLKPLSLCSLLHMVGPKGKDGVA